MKYCKEIQYTIVPHNIVFMYNNYIEYIFIHDQFYILIKITNILIMEIIFQYKVIGYKYNDDNAQ